MLTSIVVSLMLAAGPASVPAAEVPVQANGTPPPGGVQVELDEFGIPTAVNVQGYLTTATGDTFTADKQMSFKVFDAETGGTELWNWTGTVQVEASLFSTKLAIPADKFLPGARRWLQVSVEGTALDPRVEMTSAPFAYRSIKSDTATYSEAAGPTGPAEGDLDGEYPSPTVDGLQDRPVSPTAPSSGQVLKWNGSSWGPAADLTGGTGTVTSISQGTGITCSPNPITSTGTIAFDQSWGDSRYVNEGQMVGNSDRVDNYDAGNSSGQAAVSNGTRCQNLNADMLDGYHYNNLPYASSGHSHDDRYYTESELRNSGGGGQVHWNNVTSKPTIGDITAVNAGAGLTGGGVSGPVTLGIAVPLHISGSSGSDILSVGQSGSGRAIVASSSGSQAALVGQGLSGRVGVYGSITSSSEYAIYAYNNYSSSAPGIYVRGYGRATGGWVSDFGPTENAGSGIAVLSLDAQVVASGRARLTDGAAEVEFEKAFADVVSESAPVTVVVTPCEECSGIAVVRRSRSGFSVKELMDGTGAASFDWIAVGKIRGRVDRQVPVLPTDYGAMDSGAQEGGAE